MQKAPSINNNQVDKLPIHKYRQQILESIEKQSVVIISGLTGCGKSTQVPQYIFQQYPNSKIGVCQPRRLAATSLALRVSQQRNQRIGKKVGYKIGLQTKRSQSTQLIYMTYGILIQQLLFKEQLEYDFIILDQVHERSLQMDFAFVILKKMINKRIQEKSKKETKIPNQLKQDQNNQQNTKQQNKDHSQIEINKDDSKSAMQNSNKQSKQLKLLVMSATLDSQLFQKYFSVHKESHLIIEPKVNILRLEAKNQDMKQNKRGTRGNVVRTSNEEDSKNMKLGQRKVQYYYDMDNYRQGKCIYINQKSRFQVKQIYLDELLPYFQVKPPQLNYPYQDEVRLQQKHYQWGIKLIDKVYRDIQYEIQYSSKNNSQESSTGTNNQFVDQTAGDILVFLPGLIQINRMKYSLIQKNQKFKQTIVEVHSVFSEQLYYKLFKSKVKNKIILSTNIGESSITLPNCKVVIDYCLNRKAVKNSKQGLSSFTTTVASLSNLIQRKGRVGRVSDGIIYRMITRKQVKNLQPFDVPEIKCVNLQMTILKTKKLESTYKCQIFQDIYDIFLNVLDPPDIKSIDSAIQNLINEDALQQLGSNKNQLQVDKNSGKKYIGKNLKITKVGQFMVSMPCQLAISKLILMGIKLGIASAIIDIATIILSTKSFFTHQQKRFNIQQFMHGILGYDQGDNNDYLLRQRLFDHWRSKFYIPFKKQQQTKNQSQPKNISYDKNQTALRIFDFGEEIQFDQNYGIVQKFNDSRIHKDQLEFCKNRGTFANHMRQLLRISETLKIRLEMIKVQHLKLNIFKPQVQLVLICLMYAFPDIVCQVQFQTKKKLLFELSQSRKSFHNKLIVPHSECMNEKCLKRYFQPESEYEHYKHENGWTIQSHDHTLKKFLLPKHYDKSNIQSCSDLYKHCKQSKIKYFVNYNVYQGFRNIIVLNESVNKQILVPKQLAGSNSTQKLYMISHNLIQSKGRYMIGANALITHFQLVIISMIVKKNIKFLLHYSRQFFSHIQINQRKYEIPLLLTSKQLNLIIELRALSKRGKQNQITSLPQQFDKQQLQNLLNIFKMQNKKPFEQDWEQLFIEQQKNVYNQNNKKSLDKQGFSQRTNEVNQQEENNSKNAQKKILIQDTVQIIEQSKKKKNHHKPYYQRYNEWKMYILQASQRQYKLFSTTQPTLICGHCYKNKNFVQIDQAHSFQFKSGHLKLNLYSCSWKSYQKDQNLKINTKIYCQKNHHIATVIDQDYAQIDLSNILLYAPYNQNYVLNDIRSFQQYSQILKISRSRGQEQLRRQQQKFQQYQCKICFSRQNYRKMFHRHSIQHQKQKPKNSVKDPLWSLIVSHYISNQHIQNRQKFKNSIRLYNK